MGYLDYPGLQRYHGKVQDEIDELKDDLARVDTDLYPENTVNLTTQHVATLTEHNGYYINTGSGTSLWSVIDMTPVYLQNGAGYAIYDCEAGDIFEITGKAGNAPRLWAFIDADNKLALCSPANVTATEPVQAIAPVDGKLVCNVTSRASVAPTLTKTYKRNVIGEYDERLNAIEDKDMVYDQIITSEGITSPYYHGAFDIYKSDICDDWYKGENASYGYDVDGFGEHTLYSHIIDKFDSLMTLDTGYVTKNTLGTASGTDASDNPYSLYEYVFKPKRLSETLNTKKVPKILLQCCQHGFEKGIIYGAYYFFNDLINNWDRNQRLDFIRHHVEIHLIPVVNPWGFDNESYLNANGVNLNRNYQVPNWTYIPPTDTTNSSGEEPFDQPETQIVKAWVDENLDAIMYIDGHTQGRYYASGYHNINANMPINDLGDVYYNKCFRAFVRHIEDQTYNLSKLYPAIQPGTGSSQSSFCGRIQSDDSTTPKGTANRWASIYKNLVAFTFEVMNGLAVGGTNIILYMSPESKKINSAMLGNCIAEILREYA